MEDLPLGRIAALVPEFAVKDLPLGRTLMMIEKKLINRYIQRVSLGLWPGLREKWLWAASIRHCNWNLFQLRVGVS